ncbi:MAG: hypothetical protein OXE57_14830 [Alphaproteobacteria bacterium]|nr:hypothetical protein [Alphaproteobacteria bacterium]
MKTWFRDNVLWRCGSLRYASRVYLYQRADEALKVGMCRRCTQNPVVPGYVHCEACMEKNRGRENRKRQRRVEAGLCAQCGGPKDDGRRRMCAACRAKHADIMRKRRAAR